MRYLRPLLILVAIATAQGVLLLSYRLVEEGRRKPSPVTFLHERLPGRALPEIALHDARGAQVPLAELRGRPVLLHFWATWCPPCRDELPGLLDLGRELERKHGPKLIALVLDDDWAKVNTFFGGAIPAEVLHDSTGLLAKAFEVGVLPETFLIEADRSQVLRFAGARQWDGEAARAVLAGPGGAEMLPRAAPWRAVLDLLLFGTFLALAFGVRTWRHWRATGSTGFHGISGRPGSAEWFGGVLFVLGLLLGVAAPIAQSAELVRGLFLAPAWADGLGVTLALLGIGGTSWSQASMGTSWRIGVSGSERTELIERGPFRWVRNPIFSFMVLTAAGLALLMPNALSLAALGALVLAVELQVRFAEEPYLLRVHGERYSRYCQRAGRFIPGLGRVR
jgi:protein-S-isoprenylcysteine O-methyltransferase Ste14/thiol-disulfide isomerase/thioredoxin